MNDGRKEYKVMVSNVSSNYRVGLISASNEEEACKIAKEVYRTVLIVWRVQDADEAHFYVVDNWPKRR